MAKPWARPTGTGAGEAREGRGGGGVGWGGAGGASRPRWGARGAGRASGLLAGFCGLRGPTRRVERASEERPPFGVEPSGRKVGQVVDHFRGVAVSELLLRDPFQLDQVDRRKGRDLRRTDRGSDFVDQP